ncbi:MAG: sortase [Roseiflexaceae bacterium]
MPTDNQEPHDLLQALLEKPPAPRGVSLTPAALRSVEAQRDHALRGFLRRTWVDGILKHAEPLLLLAALVVFGFWLADGPLRDWLYAREQQASATPAPVRAPAAQPTAAAEAQAAALPFVTSAMSETGELDGVLAPRRALPAPREVAPQPTRLTIPAIQVDTPVKEVFVVDGVWEVAEYAAGYLHGTALPGDGNTALAGHAGLRGAVFRDLGRLKPGDDVYLEAGGWSYRYRVRSLTNVWPTQIEVLDQTPTPVLTMLTCTNWDTQRLVVVADLIDAKPSPSA